MRTLYYASNSTTELVRSSVVGSSSVFGRMYERRVYALPRLRHGRTNGLALVVSEPGFRRSSPSAIRDTDIRSVVGGG